MAAYMPASRLPQQGAAPSGSMGTNPSAFTTTDTDAFSVPIHPRPAADASQDEKLDFVENQLLRIGEQEEILGGLKLLGFGLSQQMRGGQAIVQMARNHRSGVEYAIKFFIHRTIFEEEAAIYRNRNAGLGRHAAALMLPHVRNIEANDDCVLCDPSGVPLPPFIVMERGESLDQWSGRNRPDMWQAVSVIKHIAERLQALHAAGYVHRDVKPANVLWLPRENRWTVIDFGCVAQIGASVGAAFSPSYAAPEAVRAHKLRRALAVTTALDAWSIGVLFYELLTGKAWPAINEGKEKMMERIQGIGGLRLPWEGVLDPVVRRKLGVFKTMVLRLLDRNPDNRPLLSEFTARCDAMLQQSTTMDMRHGHGGMAGGAAAAMEGGGSAGTLQILPPASVGQVLQSVPENSAAPQVTEQPAAPAAQPDAVAASSATPPQPQSQQNVSQGAHASHGESRYVQPPLELPHNAPSKQQHQQAHQNARLPRSQSDIPRGPQHALPAQQPPHGPGPPEAAPAVQPRWPTAPAASTSSPPNPSPSPTPPPQHQAAEPAQPAQPPKYPPQVPQPQGVIPPEQLRVPQRAQHAQQAQQGSQPQQVQAVPPQPQSQATPQPHTPPQQSPQPQPQPQPAEAPTQSSVLSAQSSIGASASFVTYAELCMRMTSAADHTPFVMNGRTFHPMEAGTTTGSQHPGWAQYPMWPTRGEINYGNVNGGLYSLKHAGPEALIATVSGAHKTLSDALLHLGEQQCLVFDGTCRKCRVDHTAFKGGVIVCTGAGCQMLFHKATFCQSTLVVLDGADVILQNCNFSADSAFGSGLSLLAHGAQTKVTLRDTTVKGGLQGAAAHAGARLDAKRTTFCESELVGLEVKDAGSTVVVAEGCRVIDMGSKFRGFKWGFWCRGIYVHLRSYAQLVDVSVKGAEWGIHVRGAGAALERVNVSGCSNVGIRFSRVANGTLSKCTVSDCGTDGIWFSHEGTRANVSGCTCTKIKESGLRAAEGAQLDAQNCNCDGCGMGFVAHKKGWLRMTGCNGRNNTSGVQVSDAGTQLQMIEGVIQASKQIGVVVWQGAEADVRGVGSSGNRRCGFMSTGAASRLWLLNCRGEDVIACEEEDGGQVVVGEGCAFAGAMRMAPVAAARHPAQPPHPVHPAHPAHPAQPPHPVHPAHQAQPPHPAHPAQPPHPAHPSHPPGHMQGHAVAQAHAHMHPHVAAGAHAHVQQQQHPQHAHQAHMHAHVPPAGAPNGAVHAPAAQGEQQKGRKWFGLGGRR